MIFLQPFPRIAERKNAGKISQEKGGMRGFCRLAGQFYKAEIGKSGFVIQFYYFFAFNGFERFQPLFFFDLPQGFGNVFALRHGGLSSDRARSGHIPAECHVAQYKDIFNALRS